MMVLGSSIRRRNSQLIRRCHNLSSVRRSRSSTILWTSPTFTYSPVINAIHQTPSAHATTPRITTRPNNFTFRSSLVLTKACSSCHSPRLRSRETATSQAVRRSFETTLKRFQVRPRDIRCERKDLIEVRASTDAYAACDELLCVMTTEDNRKTGTG
jgi:hypothetical protein